MTQHRRYTYRKDKTNLSTMSQQKEVTAMNISPSDTDVRQGYSLAESVSALQKDTTSTETTNTAQTASSQSTQQTADATDDRSKEVAAAADKNAAKEAAQKLDDHFQNTNTGLKIRVLDDSQHTIQVEVVDQKSNKVLRQIPQDEVLKLAASMKNITGVLVNKPT